MNKKKVLILISSLSLLLMSSLFIEKSSFNLGKAYAYTNSINESEPNSKAVLESLTENTQEAVGRRLFERYINQNKRAIAGMDLNGILNSNEVETFTDYKINSVKVVVSEQDRFIVNISYDIQFTEKSNKWVAGNGKVQENNWIRNKTNYVEIVRENNQYKIDKIYT
ncbi:MAG: hypothetical protein E7207_00670 [Clostridium butyricum]|nr:hypothetical protein [Clostridium butyricum]